MSVPWEKASQRAAALVGDDGVRRDVQLPPTTRSEHGRWDPQTQTVRLVDGSRWGVDGRVKGAAMPAADAEVVVLRHGALVLLIGEVVPL